MATADDRVLLEAVRDTAARHLAAADSRIEEYGVTTFPLGGPSRMLLIATRTRVHDPDSAAAYLTRCRRIPAYLDQCTEMLRVAAQDGLLPVAPLVDSAIKQLNDHLSHPARDPLLSHQGPEGWASVASWRDELERVGREHIRPAIGRYADLLAERLTDMFRPPMPPPCAVELMPPHMAEFGAPPYYSPPDRDGARPGAYLFNNIHPGQAGQWALEATAFHEAIPGHHVQFARLQLMPQLPRLLTAFYVVPHGEGWGLYARGWSRDQARAFALVHSPMPPGFVDAEIDRYIAVPGQALGYLIGQREILRLREDARSRLGAAFDLRDFHSAILDHGSVSLTVLGRILADWVAAAGAASLVTA